MTPIETTRLIIRNWEDRDRDLFHRINYDETVMAFFPFRRNREESDQLMEKLRAGISERGFGFSALEIKESGETIGFAGLHETGNLPLLPEGTIEIGWRLAPEFWGKGYVSEAAKAWLAHGFETLSLDEVVSFAVAGNKRSTAVMLRIGMAHDAARDFDHPAVPDTHPHLKQHVFYRLSRTTWLTQNPLDFPSGN